MLPLMAARIGLFVATVAEGCWNEAVPLPIRLANASGVETREGADGERDGGNAAGGGATLGDPGAPPLAEAIGAVPKSVGAGGGGAGGGGAGGGGAGGGVTGFVGTGPMIGPTGGVGGLASIGGGLLGGGVVGGDGFGFDGAGGV